MQTRNPWIHKILFASLLISCVTMSACVPPNTPPPPKTQLQDRIIQSRSFETRDKLKMIRSVVATLQDLNFVVDKTDADLGLVTATRMNGSKIRVTITVREWGKAKLLVRMNAVLNNKPIEDPSDYQDFFNNLGKSLMLDAQVVIDGGDGM